MGAKRTELRKIEGSLPDTMAAGTIESECIVYLTAEVDCEWVDLSQIDNWTFSVMLEVCSALKSALKQIEQYGGNGLVPGADEALAKADRFLEMVELVKKAEEK
jgi:hypothetical protein